MLDLTLSLYRSLKRKQLHFMYYLSEGYVTFVTTHSIHKLKLNYQDWIEFHYQIGEPIYPLVYEMPDDDWLCDNENDYN